MSETKKFELNPSVAILIAGVIIAGAIVFTKQGAPSVGGNAAPAPTISAADIRPPTAGDHIVGSLDAPIVLIEYSDFQCPFCSMVHPTIKRIVSESNGKIAWVYRQFPLTSIHPEATPAANASECIAAQLGNAGFWKYTDAVFANQQKLSSAYSAQLANEFGADIKAYNACISASTFQKNIDADVAEASAAGGTGTPFTIVLNQKTGKAAPVSGALPYAQFVSVIKSLE